MIPADGRTLVWNFLIDYSPEFCLRKPNEKLSNRFAGCNFRIHFSLVCTVVFKVYIISGWNCSWKCHERTWQTFWSICFKENIWDIFCCMYWWNLLKIFLVYLPCKVLSFYLHIICQISCFCLCVFFFFFYKSFAYVFWTNCMNIFEFCDYSTVSCWRDSAVSKDFDLSYHQKKKKISAERFWVLFSKKLYLCLD